MSRDIGFADSRPRRPRRLLFLECAARADRDLSGQRPDASPDSSDWPAPPDPPNHIANVMPSDGSITSPDDGSMYIRFRLSCTPSFSPMP